MNIDKTLKTLYKQNSSLEIKNRILNLLINKLAIVSSSDIDFTFETLLNDNKIFPSRYSTDCNYIAFYKI